MKARACPSLKGKPPSPMKDAGTSPTISATAASAFNGLFSLRFLVSTDGSLTLLSAIEKMQATWLSLSVQHASVVITPLLEDGCETPGSFTYRSPRCKMYAFQGSQLRIGLSDISNPLPRRGKEDVVPK
jgi:hypothetical protein